MTTWRLAARFVGVCALVAPLSSGLFLVAAPAAHADGSISQPTAGAVISSGSTLTASATVNSRSAQTTLSLEGPGYPKRSTTVGTNLTQSQTISLSVPTGGGTDIRNGSWTVTLSGGATGTRTFTTNFAPATPTEFAAQGSGDREVAFSWSKGREPDLSGYTLLEGGASFADLDVSSACSGGNCSFSSYYPTSRPGTHDYTLVARRPGGSGGSVSSGEATASAALVSPTSSPAPAPGSSGSPAPGGTGGGGTGGSSTGGAGTTKDPRTNAPSLADPLLAQRRPSAVTFSGFSPSLLIPHLPALPASLPSLAGAEAGPLPQGTFAPTLDYGSRTEKTATTLARPIAVVHDVLDSERLARSLAAALLLLLVGAHLRRFLGTHAEE